MPHYRINIKLEQEAVKEYLIEDDRREVDLVYNDYRKRVFDKNGAGRVVYFDLVMISAESLQHLEDRMEVYNPANDFGYKPFIPTLTKWGKQKKAYDSKYTLAERSGNKQTKY